MSGRQNAPHAIDDLNSKPLTRRQLLEHLPGCSEFLTEPSLVAQAEMPAQAIAFADR